MKPTRRVFLAGAASALAGCGGAVPATTGLRALLPSSSRTPARVVIVGAGVAGLTCAYRLQQAGIASRVFEANDRIGGRTWTLRGYFAQDQIAEHGGEFISLNQIPVRQLARELGLKLVNVNRRETGRTIYFFDGEPYTVREAHDDYFGGVRQRLREDVRAAGYPTTYDQSTPAGRALDRMSVTEWIDKRVPDGTGSKLGALLINASVGEFGADPDVQSALNLLYLIGLEKHRRFNIDGTDEALHVVGGMDQIAARMAAALPDGTIAISSALVAVRERADGSLTCTFDSGHVRSDVSADCVCLALPFTTLRDVDLRRVPLSARKRIAIDHLDLGTNAKLHLQFRQRVWKDERYDGASYVQFPYEESWDVSAGQAGDYGILVGFPGGHHGIIPGPAHGPAPTAIADAYVRQLDRIYPGIARQYTGTAYLDVWAHDRWHHGAYSYYRAGQYTRFAGIEGVPEGNVFFAGEHTSYNNMGYVNGAVITGERAAREITRRLG